VFGACTKLFEKMALVESFTFGFIAARSPNVVMVFALSRQLVVSHRPLVNLYRLKKRGKAAVFAFAT
jgi:hypothetical protein